MRFLVGAVLACSTGIAHADHVQYYSTADVQDPEPWTDGMGPMLAAEVIGGSMLIGGGFFYSMGDRSGWSAAAVWASLPLLAVGPSISHFYTGDYAVGATGAAANTLGLTLCGLAIHHFDVLGARNPPDGHFDARGKVEMYGGLALFLGSTFFEVIDTLRVIRRHHVAITPTGTGLALSGQF
ncbi:MAG TPA: hypothetical protein VF403_15765 [Kofleriaceae bacterium]